MSVLFWKQTAGVCIIVCCLSQPMGWRSGLWVQQCVVWEKSQLFFPLLFSFSFFTVTVLFVKHWHQGDTQWHTSKNVCHVVSSSSCFRFVLTFVFHWSAVFFCIFCCCLFAILVVVLPRRQESQTNAITRQHAFTGRMFMNRFLTENPSKSTSKSKTE